MVERISRPRSSRPSRVAKSVIQASRSSWRPVAQPDHREPRVLERPGEAGAPVGPLGHDVRAQRDHTLDVRGEVRGRDLVRDVEDLREELAEDAVTHRGPGAWCMPTRCSTPPSMATTREAAGIGTVTTRMAGLGSVTRFPAGRRCRPSPMPRRAWATRRGGRPCGGGTAGPEGGEAEGAGAGQCGSAGHRGGVRTGPLVGHLTARAAGGRGSTARTDALGELGRARR